MLEDEQFDEQDDGQEPRPPAPLDKHQKIAAASLAVFAILIVVLWVAQLRSNIYGPFNSPAGNQTAAPAQNSDAALKAKDTDVDGLSDYDELNQYNTSPYLSDTDSDGFKDSEEIKNNADPNCPAGRDCAAGSLIPEQGGENAAADDTLNNLLNQFGPPAGEAGATAPAAALNNDQLNALKNIDAASLRALLIQQGMPKETLDKISDADLLKSYQETLDSGQ